MGSVSGRLARDWPKVGGFRAEMAGAETALDLSRTWFTDGDALSGCPCFTLELDELEIDGNCWRIHGPDEHPLDPNSEGYCCLHLLRGDPADAQRLQALLTAMDWYGAWSLIDERGPEPTLIPDPRLPDLSA